MARMAASSRAGDAARRAERRGFPHPGYQAAAASGGRRRSWPARRRGGVTLAPNALRAPRVTSRMTGAIHLAIAIVLAWGALAFGAVYSWAFWPLAMVAGACGVAGLVTRPVRGSHEHGSAARLTSLPLIWC